MINQKVAVKILENFGIVSEVANTGREAMHLLETRTYDLVLMDIQMPEMDGYEATAEIRKATGGTINPHIPIIAMTANAMKGDQEKCLRCGMNDYVAKPVDPPILLAKLKKWLPCLEN